MDTVLAIKPQLEEAAVLVRLQRYENAVDGSQTRLIMQIYNAQNYASTVYLTEDEVIRMLEWTRETFSDKAAAEEEEAASSPNESRLSPLERELVIRLEAF